jgi:hypothetical protein
MANYARDKETRQLAATDAVFLLKKSQRYLKPIILNQLHHYGQQPEKENVFFKNQAE